MENNFHMIFYFAPVFLFLLGAIFVHYKLKIKDQSLVYQVILFDKLIYEKEVHLDEVKHVKLKRVGWKTKCAIIHVTKELFSRERFVRDS